VKGLDAESKAIKEEGKKLSEKTKILDGQSARLKAYLGLEAEGMTLKDENSSIGWRKSEKAVLLVEPEQLPEEFQNKKISANLTEVLAQI